VNKRTPLYDVHIALGARVIDFGGWDMPVQYEGIIPETHATRRQVGLFDIGHMGRIELIGPDHVKAADWVMTCDVAALKTGRIKYGILSTERGTAIDDVLVYADVDRTHLVINAGGRDVDLKHVREQIAAKKFNVRAIAATDPNDPGIKDTFLGCAQQMLALQGPNSEMLLAKLVDPATDLSKLGYYRMTRGQVNGLRAIISRTGYTGEDGFEVFFDARESTRMWSALAEAGKLLGVKPIGLGARDALRTEAGMPLYGHELDLETTPLEARLDFGVQLTKAPFLGKEALERQKAQGLPKVLVGFEVDTKRVPRNGCPLLKDGKVVGVVASGTFAPTLDKNIGMGFVPPSLVEPGSKFDVDIRGGIHGCTVVPLPFYKRKR
jgi:aminomethyltransferase